jgi:hypothetical protein
MDHFPTDWSIDRRIYFIRGERVMLDRDLAELYGVPTKVFNRAVKRQLKRFPPAFRFQLTVAELAILRCQIGTSSWGGRRYLPWAFTEDGVSMLSGVLDSDRAINVHIMIIQAFSRMRRLLAGHADLARKLDELEKKYDATFKVVFDELRAMREFQPPQEPPRPAIGFKAKEEK